MKFSRYIAIAFLIISAIGFADASYLTYEHYDRAGGPIPCAVFTGCGEVVASAYSTVGNIPVSLAGMVYYLTMFILIAAFIATERDLFLYVAVPLSVAGFLASLIFVYLQVFVIGAICTYCMISALTSTLLFALSLYVMGIRGMMAATRSVFRIGHKSN